MRELIGHKVRMAVEQMGMVEGIVVDDRPSMVLLKGQDGKITRIVKIHICGFVPLDSEPFKYVPFHVLFCENKKIKCPGVQYVKEGEGFNREDVEVFVGPCPCRNSECVMGTKGELRSVSGEFLRTMIEGTMFGSYPKKEEKHGNVTSKARFTETIRAAAKGKGKG